MIYENTPLIETNRLILRKFTADDAEDAMAIFKDEQVNAFLPWFTVKTLKEAEMFLQSNFLAFYDKNISYNYAIELKSNSRVIGYVTVHDIDGSNDLGYGLQKEFWHKGITTEACLALINRLRQTGLPFITATHDTNNKNSGEVMKKLGMTYRYSYNELWQPKNILVTFKMYQLNFNGNNEYTYMEYWNKHINHWV